MTHGSADAGTGGCEERETRLAGVGAATSCAPGGGSRGVRARALGRTWQDFDMTNALTATLRTNRGTVAVRLFPDHAPKTVRNFVELAEGGREWTDPRTRKTGSTKLYDGTIFHRVIPDFMIQGGDPLGTGTGGPGYKFADEIHPDLVFDRPYLLAMANAGPGTNGSQFFITTAPTPWLTGKHTIFGEVISGSEVVDAISKVQTGRNDRPADDVVLESVLIERDGGQAESGS
jgi:peptidyl-prolyl cis-trans isomerase A (cyclophilin A)